LEGRKLKIVQKVFNLMDRAGSGKVSIGDLVDNYDVSSNKMYQSG
jgi:Ca2+-binding EF-hand superfamily protein